MFTLELLRQDNASDYLKPLSTILIDSVLGGGSVGFLEDITQAEAEAYWQSVFAMLSDNHLLYIARNEAGEVAGTAQLDLATRPNSRRRAEVQKVLVHSSQRGKGLGKLLMQEVEAAARARNLSLLILDTIPGSIAEQMYQKLGFVRLGEIPDYVIYQGGMVPTTIFYKQLQ